MSLQRNTNFGDIIMVSPYTGDFRQYMQAVGNKSANINSIGTAIITDRFYMASASFSMLTNGIVYVEMLTPAVDTYFDGILIQSSGVDTEFELYEGIVTGGVDTAIIPKNLDRQATQVFTGAVQVSETLAFTGGELILNGALLGVKEKTLATGQRDPVMRLKKNTLYGLKVQNLDAATIKMTMEFAISANYGGFEAPTF